MNVPASAMEQVRPDDALIVAHGARSLLVTLVAIVMTLASLAWTPHLRLPWYFVPVTYALVAAIAHLKCRTATSGGVVPLGTWGDSRFMLAVVAAIVLAITPATMPIAAVMSFILLTIAASLCGLADGAWVGTAQRHLRLSFFQTLRTFLRAIRSGEATGWRVATGGRP